MKLFSTINTEIEAAKKLKQVKLSLFKSIMVFGSAFAFVVAYYSVFLPIKQNASKVPEIIKGIEIINMRLSEAVPAPIDTIVRQSLTEIQKDITEIKGIQILQKQQFCILKEELNGQYPTLIKRLDDVQTIIDQQNNYLKKNDIGMIPYQPGYKTYQ